jgi:hypothetical protein
MNASQSTASESDPLSWRPNLGSPDGRDYGRLESTDLNAPIKNLLVVSYVEDSAGNANERF